MYAYKPYQTRTREEDNTWEELAVLRRREQHGEGNTTDTITLEDERASENNEFVIAEAIYIDNLETSSVLQESTSDKMNFFNYEGDDSHQQEKLKSEFQVYAEHKLELIDRGIDLIPNVKRKPPTKEEKKEAFIKDRDKFLKRMSRSENNFWGTDKYDRLLEKWFPDYTLVLEHKVSEIQNTIGDSITDFNQKISTVIKFIEDGLIRGTKGDINTALRLINDSETYLTEAVKSKDNAIITLNGFPESKTQDFLPQYDTVLNLYRELVQNLQTALGGMESDNSKFESTISQLSKQQASLIDFNLKVQSSSDVLELVQEQNTEFTDLINSTVKIIEDAKKLERTADAPDSDLIQSKLDEGKATIATLDKKLVEITEGVSSVYWGKGIYYNEEVDALYIVATDYSAAAHYTRVVKFDGFWFFVNSETGWISGIQQKDAFKKYYSTNPIYSRDYKELTNCINRIEKSFSNVDLPVTDDSLSQLFLDRPQDFRMLIEQVQLQLFGSSKITGFGLLTPETKENIEEFNILNPPPKAKLESPEETDMKFTSFEKAGIVGDPGTDQEDKSKSGANLRSQPDGSADNIIQWMPFNTRVFVQSKTSQELGWYFVKTEYGEEGYVAQWLINTNLPDSDARLYVIKEGDTALGIARMFYSQYSDKSLGQVQYMAEDFRNYVDKIVQYNANTPGIFYDGDKEWDNVELIAGLRIWIPSPMRMYEMIRNTSTMDLHGKSAYVTLAQDVFDYAPQNLLIHQLLKLWRSIPQEDLNDALQKTDEVALYILKSLRISNMEWLDAILAVASPGLFAAGKLLAFMREFTIGYIEYMHSLDAQTRVKSMERFLFSYTQLDYFVGIAQGIIDGIGDWFKDIGAIFEGIYNFITDLPKYIDQIKEAFGDASQSVVDIIEFLNDPSSADSIKDLLENFNPLNIFTWIDAGIQKAGQSAGKSVAQKTVSMMNLSPIELGRKIGWLIGYLIPEVILAIASSGIGTAIKIGAQAIAKVMRVIFNLLGKAIKVTLEAIKAAISAIDDIIKSIKAIATFFVKSGNNRVSKFFEKLQELFKKFKAFLKRKSLWQSHDYSKLGKVAPCFPAGTIVKTPQGNKPIETVKVGDCVYTFDFEKQITTESYVLNTFENWTENLVEIVINEDLIQATRDHVFWVESEQKWLPASELCEEMQVRLSNGNIVPISSISIVEEKCDTFNLQIGQHSNYFVGINGVLVHNDSKFEDLTKKNTEIYEVFDPKTKEVKYVGQTTRGTEIRWQEHLTKDHPDWESKGYKVRKVKDGNWTPYEASVWEQHYMEKHGGKVKLENKINVITEGKYNQYKHLHNPC